MTKAITAADRAVARIAREARQTQTQQESDIECEACDAGIYHTDCELALVVVPPAPDSERTQRADYEMDDAKELNNHDAF